MFTRSPPSHSSVWATVTGSNSRGIAALAALALAPSPLLLVLFVVLFGPSQGSRGPIVAALVTELFPGPRVGAIYGAASTGLGLGAAGGAFLAGWLHDLTGAYWAGFALAALAALSALGQFWWIGALARISHRPHER